MARISEDMVRRRAEHNECEITTLEELSLHQLDIQKIEHLDRWCKRLKILYLQSNLIAKIENVGRLKELEYLNLALNNVTKIENLQKCESLQKLDLTINFVGDLLSIASLKENIHLQELFLTGNPCTDYDGYRDFVIVTLPQLKWLDGKEISRFERILAQQRMPKLRELIIKQQEQYELKLLKEKEESKSNPDIETKDDTSQVPHSGENVNGNKDSFVEEMVPHTPESRTALHKELSEKRKEGKEMGKDRNPNPPKRERQLERNGKMLNVNEGRYDFTLEENDEKQCFIVDVSCPKFMDTSLLDCDVQPSYVRITIKGKILQLVLPDEVSPDASNAKRSQTTGHLVVTMPKANPCIKQKKKASSNLEKKLITTSGKDNSSSQYLEGKDNSSSQYLEVVENNILNIAKQDEGFHFSNPVNKTNSEVLPSEDFIDDPDVPPLI